MALFIRVVFQHAILAPLNRDWPRTKGLHTGTIQDFWILGKILGITQLMKWGYERVGLVLLNEKLSLIPIIHTSLLVESQCSWRWQSCYLCCTTRKIQLLKDNLPLKQHLRSQEMVTDLALIDKKIMSKTWQTEVQNTLLKSLYYWICHHWECQWSCSDLRNRREGLNHHM